MKNLKRFRWGTKTNITLLTYQKIFNFNILKLNVGHMKNMHGSNINSYLYILQKTMDTKLEILLILILNSPETWIKILDFDELENDFEIITCLYHVIHFITTLQMFGKTNDSFLYLQLKNSWK